MRLVNNEKLAALQKSPANVRNVCILAHVDHGKTTLADSLVASNGIISQKMAGKLRYMDSRQDEQERGITMKSSSIALYFSTKEEREFLINLIDSPGHVDFSSEVSTAVRLCDGAIIVVDVVEGVCPQTRLALKQVWVENIKPVLVLNKIDRLITEMKLPPLDAYVHLTQVLEQINAVMGELFATEVMSRDDVPKTEMPKTSSDEKTFDWSTGLEDEDDSNLYFAPEFENVVFASAIDGWGFRVKEFAKIFTAKLGINENLLKKVLWGDFYLNTKTKRVHKGAQEKAKKPLFVQLVLENLWTLYEAVVVRKDRDKMLNIVEKLDIKLTARDLRHTDSKVQLNAIMSQWLPLANSILEMVSEKLPSPLEIKPERVEKLMSSQTRRFETLPKESQDLKGNFLECSADESVPVIVFISKLIPVERKSLPQFKPKPLTQEEIVQRKEQARLRHAQLQNELQSTGSMVPLEKTNETVSPKKEDEQQDVFVAFARIFSGTIRVGDDLFVLGPKHDPCAVVGKNIEVDPSLTLKDLRNNQHITKVKVDSLYLLMGRDLESLQDVPAGNVCGIGGLEEHVLKTATLSTTVACPSFTELQIMAVPIVRVAVEPKQLVDMPDLRRGLRLLNQADACVQVLVQETGEHVLITAGEVHLERCLDDLKQRYAKIEINVSEPIVPFRETVVPPPTVDMTNEAIQEQTAVKSDDDADGSITISTPNKQVQLKLKAVPLPTEVTDLLENNAELLKSWNTYLRIARMVSKENAENTSDDTLRAAVQSLERQVDEAFNSAGDEWKHAAASMWCVGPRQCGPNVLLNRIADYERVSMWTDFSGTGDPRSFYDSSLVNGFQLATLAGPLCEEPMMGVCFVVESWTLDETISDSSAYGPLSGQILSAMKDGCRRAFQAKPQRLMAAMYSCNILVNAEVLGKMYAVLARRNGRVLSGDMMQGSGNFTVTAVLPVVESFSFAPEIRKQTSGLASPQLVFSHWEVIDIDPFWTPTTEEEYLHFGEKGDSFNRARRYMDNVRRRKGLAVEEKLVEFAEKQRTLSKNK